MENKNQYLERVELLCEKFNISDVLGTKVKNYSLGMKHRLFLACIIAREIKLLLLDEPLTTLDFESQEIAIKELKKLSIKGIAIIFTSHIEQLQSVLATKIYEIIDKKFLFKSNKTNKVVQSIAR